MSLESSDSQIKKGYEELAMTPQEIADDLTFEVLAVKSKLMQISAKYRKDCGHADPEDETLNFTEEELRQVNRVIFDIAIGAEDPHLRFKAATWVRDDKKGRKEVVKAVQHTNNFNMLNFNETIQLARQKAQEARAAISNSAQRIIEA